MDNILDKIYTWSKASIVDEILIFAMLIAFVETYAQNTIKNSGDSQPQFLIGVLLYGIVGYLLHFSYSKFPLSKVNITWSSISIILATILGYLLYSESLNTWKIAAVVFGIIAIYCCAQSD